MKKIIFVILIIIVTVAEIQSQVIYSSGIDSILKLVSADSISRMNKELSGDTTVIVAGVNRKIYSRFYLSPDNVRAAKYIWEKFNSYGYQAKYMINNLQNNNVYAVKTGTKYPDKKIIIGAHYDDIISPVFPGMYDTIHGADDNASGVCCVLEAARLLAGMQLDYTVIFVAFDEEEMGLFGSKAFADSCFARNEDIIGVLNLDMIGWDGNNDNKFVVLSDSNSYFMHKLLGLVLKTYSINLHFSLYNESWDEGSFQHYGYSAITMAEEARNSFNPYYHTINETFNKFNVPYFQKMVKAGIGLVLTMAMDKIIYIDLYHNPLINTTDITERTAVLKIKSKVKIAGGTNEPRLYYKTDGGSYNFITASYINGDSLSFVIPGYTEGTKISYYFALQNSMGEYTCTLPEGGDGVNPPGTIPPQEVYEYVILNANSFCSNTLPKPILENALTSDTIHIPDKGNLSSVSLSINITHPNDGDLVAVLYKNNAGSITLFSSVGEGGQNFINTVFEDTASVKISEGLPPFTGRFKPAQSFSVFKNKDISGDWILKILDKKTGNTGTLQNWCLQLTFNTTGVNEALSIVPDKFELFQNYPNPFNPVTNIKYQIAKSGYVTLKIYDILGREVETLVSEFQKAGVYETQFPGNKNINPASGVYFYRLSSGDFTEMKRMLMIK